MSSAHPSGPGAAAPRKVWWGVLSVAAVALSSAGFFAFRSSQRSSEEGSRAQPTAPVAVQVAQAEHSDLQVTKRYHGELWTEVAELSAQLTGRLEAVGVRLGEQVARGAVLARLDTAQLRRQIDEAEAQVGAARADERRIQAELAAAEVELERGQRLLSEKLIPAQEMDALRSRRAVLEAQSQAARARAEQSAARVALLRVQLEEASLRAPFDGAVARRYLDPGALVQPGTPILRLVQAGPLRVRFRIPERDLKRVAAGHPIAVSTEATSDRTFAGRITQLSPEVSAQDRMLVVEGVLSEQSELLRTGMHAEVLVTVRELSGVTVIPPAALVERALGERRERGVYVVEDGLARFRPVTVLGRSGDQSAVDGLEPGAQVVTLGHEQLHDGAAVSSRGRVGS